MKTPALFNIKSNQLLTEMDQFSGSGEKTTTCHHSQVHGAGKQNQNMS